MTKLTPHWKFGELLEREGITAYRLHKYLTAHDVSRATVYRWTHEPPKSLDLELAGLVLGALREATGKPYSLVDLLEYRAEETEDEDVSGWQSLAGIWDHPSAPADGSANLERYLDKAFNEEERAPR